MNIRKLFYLKKINIAKVVMFSCIFLFAFLFNNIKVEAQAKIEILSSTYSGNGKDTAVQEINGISYIQGTGVSNQDGITFKITDMYTGSYLDQNSGHAFTAFAVWESGFSSSSDNADYDRWYIRAYVCTPIDVTCEGFNSLKSNRDVMKDASGNIIYQAAGSTRYYILRESAHYVTGVAGYAETVVDFTKFFTDAEVTYTYRIRNANYLNRADKDGFGYKQIQINYWKSNDGSGDPIYPQPQVVEFGLARPISDVSAYTNNHKDGNGNDHSKTNPIACGDANKLDSICVDYVDTNGDPTKSTTIPATTVVRIPDNVLYAHVSTTKNQVQANLDDEDKIDMTYVSRNNTTYAFNYFCEGEKISVATITYNSSNKHSAKCDTGLGELRKYLYVESKLLNLDATSIDIDDFEDVNQTTKFVNEPYKVQITVDSRGNYVLFITDVFKNVNEVAVVKVMDIINQSIIANFKKSNKTSEVVVDSDGWKADEYLTNQDVAVTITMSATTVIKEGLPIIEAQTTLLDSTQVKYVYYWRVDGSKYDSDICQEGEKENCAMKPNDVIKLYESTGANVTKHESFVSFIKNELTLNIGSNGRYRFYVETFGGNNTNDSEGTTKNPRVEVYKIDKEAPEILFGGSDNSNCSNGTCEYIENTYPYYQGTGNESGSVIDNKASTSQSENKIVYTKNGIYYVSADGKNSILASASDGDIWFTYLYGLFNSEAYIKENLAYYNKANTMYSYFQATSATTVQNVLSDNSLKALNETKYREYIIKNNIKYTAYALASDTNVTLKEGQPSYDQSRMKIEYLDDVTSNTTVCSKISSVFNNIDLDNSGKFDQNDCVNYYLDHGIDFRIKITAYDIVQDAAGNYILGNSSTKEIKVEVVDTTAPGFNKIINNYNVGSDCRIEIGNELGTSYQTVEKLLECYGIKVDDTYNLEDNVFASITSKTQTVNTAEHISIYVLSKETQKWVNLEDGYVPNRSGQYAFLIVIRDDASTTTTFDLTGSEYHGITVANNSKITVDGNAIATVFSYYVDKKIVLIEPQANEKDYGKTDPLFDYCVYVKKDDTGMSAYLDAPFNDMDVFKKVGCTNLNDVDDPVGLTENQLKELFKGNYGVADFSGILTRQESGLYNDYHYTNTANDYVGLYKIVLGSLTISGEDPNDDYDIGEDYIIKIDPRVRNGEETQLVTIAGKRRDGGEAKCNLVDSQIYDENEVSGCYGFKEDDDFFVESTVIFTIKQVVLNVTANGAYKTYGDPDTNYGKYNSNNKSDIVTGTDAYLKGYTVSGLKLSDSANVVLGVLRREVGEHVGVYAICNYRGDALSDTVLETKNNMLILGSKGVSGYTACMNYDKYYDIAVNTGVYKDGILVGHDSDEDKIVEYDNFIKSRALYISPNIKVAYYKTLNSLDNSGNVRNNNYANYVINYTEGTFEIEPATLVVQPTPGQRREYSYNGVDEVNPWELVVYGSKDTFKVAGNGEAFTGFTTDAPVYSVGENDSQSKDLGSPDSGTENYNNASEDRNVWNLILNNVLYTGFKTNETYSLFETGTRISLLNNEPSNGVYKNMLAGWYDYKGLGGTTTLKIDTNGRKQCTYSNYISDVDTGYSGDCRDYNLVIDLDYRNEDGYKNGDTDAEGNQVLVVYKSKLGYCQETTLGEESDSDVQCSDAQASKILFEVYRREIILEFNSSLENIPSNSKDIVYGYRYDYYGDNLFKIDSNTSDDILEDKLFYCYASIKDGIVGLNGDCTSNKWYGLTDGDSWANIELSFKLHSLVSAINSGYYDSDTDKAIPAGRYYVYASIGEDAKRNYKFSYLGGTLTIKTKAVGTVLNNYTKEYGDVYYDNVACMKDGSILNSNSSLINDCSDTTNSATNTYGFVISGLDGKDTIADNFTGRPKRETKLANTNGIAGDTNGLQENVGIYSIGVGTIKSKNNNPFNSCSDNFLPTAADCVVVSGVSINNYIISNDDTYTLTYYLMKNATSKDDLDYGKNAANSIVNSDNRTLTPAKLTITPAMIDITVTSGQTKMYGCSYNSVNTVSSYEYSYSTGYDCIFDVGTNYDFGYEYTVEGDKDYYIYNYGYYEADYDFDTTYTSSKINMINTESGIDDLLLIEGASKSGIGRATGLNGGVLYRVNTTKYSDGIAYSSVVEAATLAQDLSNDVYQGQSVGTYIITLGNLNANLTSDFTNYSANNNKVCDDANNPVNGGSNVCRNYIINYYGNTSVNEEHTYEIDEADTTFTITTRVGFIYTEYNSKIYGNVEPVVSKVCSQTMVTNGFCDTVDETITYGISAYYTKYNSLAKAPWVASIETGDEIYFANNNENDVQTDVVTGLLSRYGENNGTKSIDDVVGDYNYLFSDLAKTTYASSNYELNYYYRKLKDNKIIIVDGKVDEVNNEIIKDNFGNYSQEQAVNADGGNTQIVDDETKEVLFEITLRKITVTLIDFAKVYGIADHSSYYDLGICASEDQTLEFDEAGNPKCSDNPSEHGLSPSHRATYMKDGILKQKEFKEDFKVTFLRALGENVVCNGGGVSGTLSGYFTDGESTYDYSLDCNDDSYEALGIINQEFGNLGYNYEITYVEGLMTILHRSITVTPEANQGFQYGSYTYPSLIPAIKFTTSLTSVSYARDDQKVIAYSDESTVIIVDRVGGVSDTEIETISAGLVSEGNGTVCLENIDGVNTFCIDDRQDTYDQSGNSNTTSSFVANTDGLSASEGPTYVFGDVYVSESSSRSALNRGISSNVNLRYNRNVGEYIINKGDLSDKSGNYKIVFTEGVKYVITAANVKVTPDSGQNKVYGESDKELTFKVVTTYKVNTTQYIVYDSSIASIKDKSGNSVSLAPDNTNRILVEKDSTITLNGFAYYENNGNANYNYGTMKNSNKSANSDAIRQTNVVGKSYDKYCYDNYANNSTEAIGTIAGCSNKLVSHSSTTLVLTGYLFVNGYNQKANEHYIDNGLVVSKNEFNNENYSLEVQSEVIFTINKLDINILIQDVEKVYGQATDAYKCENGVSCSVGHATLMAQDNEGMLEYNFDIYYKGKDTVIMAADNRVLMVKSIGNNYYTQSEGAEDKNNYLGINVIRKTNNDTTCTINSDMFGCEDVGVYTLSFRKFEVIGDSKDGSTRYDDNYNLMYNDENVEFEEVTNVYKVVNPSNHNVQSLEKVTVIKGVLEELTIVKKEVEIFVNTNLNSSSANYYQIEQNIEVPRLPSIDNSYNLKDYVYNSNKDYHGVGDRASSTSANTDLSSTYTKIVWGEHPAQVRISDALVGELAYCNEPSNGNNYSNTYPDPQDGNVYCGSKDNLVYNEEKSKVNTNTKEKFIIMTRDVTSTRGLKIMSSTSATKVDNNDYENKNYDVTFYAGAVNVIGDSDNPTLIIGTKDYYIEANAFNDNGTIVGATSSIGTILEYLFNGSDKNYVLAAVDTNGNMYITINNTKIYVSQTGLYTTYGNASPTYPGIVSGVEQTSIYPFASDYAHVQSGNTTYLNENNITILQQLVTTLVKWFNVSSYDSGQVINGEYLERKFDKYYYVAINKNGYDIAKNIDNTFEINKVGTYNVTFYVMDNAGRVSDDDNIARLHIIDTTAPNGGELNLYSSAVKCDGDCNVKDKWYILDSKVRLAAFNRYSREDDGNGDYIYYLDKAGEYIYFTEIGDEIGNEAYVSIQTLRDNNLISIENYVEYVDTSGTKYSAEGIIHYSWSSNPNGVYLTITGSSDNSYTVNGDSAKSQWQQYYSLDNGYYWLEYELSENMIGYQALTSDGYRIVKSTVIDNAVNKVETTYSYSISYDACYQGCSDIEVINKVRINEVEYIFGETAIVSNTTFIFDSSTTCEVNYSGTLVTCVVKVEGQDDEIKRVKLEGDRFVLDGNTYQITQNHILTASGEYKPNSKLIPKSVEINGITYRFDESAMMIYRDHIGVLGEVEENGGQNITIDGEEYLILGSDVKKGETIVANFEGYKFNLEGIEYMYIDDASGTDYYLGIESYKVYQDTFKIDGHLYSIGAFNNSLYEINNDVLRLTRSITYTDTYRLYDKFLLGVNDSYVDSNEAEEENWYFRMNITSNSKWKQSVASSTSYASEEILEYLNIKAVDFKDTKDQKIAYLDTIAPIVATSITNTVGEVTTNVRYGEDWYVYEFGYHNTMAIGENLSYYLRGITYTIDKNNNVVIDSDGKRYEIKTTGSEDESETYVYQVNYTNYYINEDYSQIKWLNGYVEKYVGVKDTPSTSDINQSESRYYNLNISTYIGKIESDTPKEIILIGNNTTTTKSSGIGSDKYATSGKSSTLYDFVYLGQYEYGIYYEDIEYSIWYYDINKNAIKVDMKEKFKECYLEDDMITRDCAQKAISEVIAPDGPSRDIVYTINYVARDKAGNASAYAARGVLFATILPSTNVVINNILQTENNSEIEVTEVEDNTYVMNANQGVSLSLIEDAFNVNYSTSQKSYNKATALTIYKGDELIVSNVKGASLANYIDTSLIADYTIIYTMDSEYVTPYGERIAVSGETVTLHLSIGTPVIEDTSDIDVEVMATNESSYVLYAIVIGAIGMMMSLGIALIIKKKKF